MQSSIHAGIILVCAGLLIACHGEPRKPADGTVSRRSSTIDSLKKQGTTMNDPKQMTDKEWQSLLTPEQYHILREKGTELPFTGKYYYNKEEGLYRCAACGNPLFTTDSQYDAGCGWPSYWKPVADSSVTTQIDRSHGMVRTEVLCGRCGGHLGHIFDDGPEPTGLRYCINSVSLDFEKKK